MDNFPAAQGGGVIDCLKNNDKINPLRACNSTQKKLSLFFENSGFTFNLSIKMD